MTRRFAPAAIAWAAAAALAAIWAATRGSLELNPLALGAGLQLSMRLDAIAFACSLAVLVAGAGLLTLRPGERWTLLPAMAAAVLAVNASDLVLTAAAAGVALLFVVEASNGAERVLWPLWAAVVMLAWAGVSLQVVGGTAGYGAAPPAALNAGIAGLVLLAAIGLVGALPAGRGWPPVAWIVMPPIGFCLLLRVFTLGSGRLPHPALGAGLALAGLLAWAVAGWRAASAAGWRELLAEGLPATAGVGVLAAGAGVQLGAVAAVFALFATAFLAVLASVATQRRRSDSLAVAAVVAGLPPGLGFVASLLAVQALLESDQPIDVLILPAALAWLLWLFAALRGVSLPPAGGAAPRWLAPGLGGVSALIGIAAGPLAAGIAQPAAVAADLGRQGPRLAAALAGLEPASGGWPALLLGGLLVVAALAVAAAAGGARLPAFSEPLPPLLPRPPLRVPAWRLPRLPGLQAAESVLSGRRPLFWAVLIAVLAVLVTRAPL